MEERRGAEDTVCTVIRREKVQCVSVKDDGLHVGHGFLCVCTCVCPLHCYVHKVSMAVN